VKTVDELAEAAIASLFDDDIRAEVAGCDWKSVSIIARQAVQNGLSAERDSLKAEITMREITAVELRQDRDRYRKLASELETALLLVNPMAKGYVHEHRVGSNQVMLDQADEALKHAREALAE